MRSINVLIIDDHPFAVEAYKNILLAEVKLKLYFNLKIDTAHNILTSLEKIKSKSRLDVYDLILLDICLPKCQTSGVNSGEGLGIIIRKLMPKTKIIVITSLNDNIRISNIFYSVDPEGFLIKTDVDSKILIDAVNTVICGKIYYSESINKRIRNNFSNKSALDELDIKILQELSYGSKMKELLQLIPLTRSGIAKKKRRLIEKLNIKGYSDRDLVLEAKKKGFI